VAMQQHLGPVRYFLTGSFHAEFQLLSALLLTAVLV
jgi:hypothetical protein